MVVRIRYASRRELEKYIEMYETLEGEILELKDIVKEYKEKIGWIYLENERIFKKILSTPGSPDLDPNDIPKNIRVNMLELDLKKIQIIATLEYLLGDLEVVTRNIKRILKTWKKQLRISGDPITDYHYARRDLYLLVDKLRYIEEIA